MASDKKPSIYSERSSIGSADELDEYGVWVKTEPQIMTDDLSSDFEEIDFPGSADDGFKSDDNFTTDFDDFAISDDSGKVDFGVPTVRSIESNINSIQNDFDTVGRNKDGDLSTQLLLKIANELSSIRGELHELKREFSGVRVPSSDEEKDISDEQASEHERSGFFSEEDDETIALTGDELDNILNTADFTEEAGANETPESDFSAEDQLGETPDEGQGLDASLADLEFDEQTQASAPAEESAIDDDFINIDADALGIDLNSGDAAADDINDTSIDEISDFAVDNTKEADDFSASDLDDTTTSAITSDDIASEDIASDDLSMDDLSSDELSMDDLSSDDFSMDDLSADDLSTDDLTKDDFATDDITTTDTASDDIEASGLDSPGFQLDEDESADTDISATETETATDDFDAEISQIDDISDDFNIDIDSDDISSPDVVDIDEKKDSKELEKLRVEGAKPVTFPPENASYLEEDEDIDIKDDDIKDDDSLDLSDAVIDEPELSTEGIADEPATEPEIDLDIGSFDDFEAVETEEAQEEDQDLEIPQDLDIDIDTPPVKTEAKKQEPKKQEVKKQTTDDFDIMSDDDSFLDDGSLDDDSFEQVIPEGFEAEIEETPVPFDDDLEGHLAAEEIEESLELPEEPEEVVQVAPPAAKTAGIAAPAPAPAPAPAGNTTIIQTTGKDYQLPSELKSELKNILSYMDQLLESLPEEKIEEFARSEYFDSYKKLFKELGLV